MKKRQNRCIASCRSLIKNRSRKVKPLSKIRLFDKRHNWYGKTNLCSTICPSELKIIVSHASSNVAIQLYKFRSLGLYAQNHSLPTTHKMLLRTQAQVSGHLPVLGFKSQHDSSGTNKNNPVKPNKRVKTKITITIAGKEKEAIYNLPSSISLNPSFSFFFFPFPIYYRQPVFFTFFFFFCLFLVLEIKLKQLSSVCKEFLKSQLIQTDRPDNLQKAAHKPNYKRSILNIFKVPCNFPEVSPRKGICPTVHFIFR